MQLPAVFQINGTEYFWVCQEKNVDNVRNVYYIIPRYDKGKGMNCKNCDKELSGRSGKKFCSANCRAQYWYKEKKDYEEELRKWLRRVNKLINDDPEQPIKNILGVPTMKRKSEEKK